MKIIVLFQKIIKHCKWCINNITDYLKFIKKVNADFGIFISHNADSSGGAPVVLLELVKTLKNDEKVCFLSEKPGELLDICKSEGIPAYTYGFLRKKFIKRILKTPVKYILINTVACYKVVNDINSKNLKMPVFLWVHEEDRLVKKYGQLMPQILNENIKVLAVSERVKKSIEKYLHNYKNIDIMYYGCNDVYNSKNDSIKNKKIIITVIGRVCNRKNQIQVIEAYELLDETIKKKIEIHFIYGSYEEKYYNDFLNKIKNYDNIKNIGRVKREKMMDVYLNTDVIICSSLDDPLPVVVTEAMMLKCLCITSSNTGQYTLIENGKNGFKYDVESTQELAKVIELAINSENNEKILEEARKLYEEKFTLDSVKKNFKKYINV